MGPLSNQSGNFSLPLVLVLLVSIAIFFDTFQRQKDNYSNLASRSQAKFDIERGFTDIETSLNNNYIIQDFFRHPGNISNFSCIKSSSCSPLGDFADVILVDAVGTVVSNGKSVGIDIFGKTCAVGQNSDCLFIVRARWSPICSTTTLPCINPAVRLVVYLEPIPNPQFQLYIRLSRIRFEKLITNPIDYI